MVFLADCLSFALRWCIPLLAAGAVLAAQPAAAAVVISQAYGGGGNAGATYTHDYVELHNTGTAAVSVAGWTVQYASSAGAFTGLSAPLIGSIPAGGYYLVRLGTNNAAVGAPLPVTPDVAGTAPNISATVGKLALVSSGTALGVACPAGDPSVQDLVGFGATSCSETTPAPSPSNTTAIFRALGGCQDSGSNGADFSAAAPLPRNSASPPLVCGGPAPVVAVCPAFNTVQGIAGSSAMTATDADSIVNAVTLVSGAVPGITLGPLVPAAADGGTARVRLEVASGVTLGSYALTLNFANNEAQNANCSVAVNVVAPPAALSTIPAIQGSAATSPLLGSSRTVRGVVTGVFPGLRGYYLQDEAGDGNPLTSDGLFVFNSAQPIAVDVGERVQVTGTVVEFAGQLGNPTVTELSNPGTVAKLGLGSIAPTVVNLPETVEGDLERYEGMLVTLTGPLSVSQNFFQGRYGQVTLSAGGRLIKPTQLHRPGTVAAAAVADDNARRRIVLDDGSSSESFFSGVENPAPVPYIGADNTLRAGDTTDSVTGIVDVGRITSGVGVDAIVDFKLHPTVTPVFNRVNARVAAPPAVGGTHKVASFNVLNYFTTFQNGSNSVGQTGQTCTQGTDPPSAALCRGADNQAEFTRQRDKIIRAIAALDADVVGLMEIQNNGVALADLVAGLNAFVGAGTYAAVPDPAVVGTDAIKLAMIHKPGRVARVGAAMSDVDAIHNRPPLAQTFQAVSNGAKFSVIVNHFKSKGCSGAAGADLDQGDAQGCFNDRRRAQASALRGFVATVQAAAADNDVLVIGDLNAYGKEDPVDTLEAGGLLADQLLRFHPAGDEYSYVFDGEAGSLDHALATASAAAQVSGAAHWHINADEPSVIDYNTDFKPQDLYTSTVYRASDHDPVLIGLNLGAGPQPQSISFVAPASQSAATGITLVATASSGLPVSFSSQTPLVCTVSGNQASLLIAGSCQVTADQAGNAAFLPATPVQRTFLVALAAQTISFAAIGNQSVGATVALNASASSGLAVSLASLTPAVCSVSGSQLTLLATGACSVRATQAGNAAYAAAAPITQGLQVLSGGAAAPDGDVPLPAWALLLLGGGLAGALRRSRAAARPGA